MKSTPRLKQFEVAYSHTQQRDINARPMPELGGQYLHTAIYTGYTEQEAWNYFEGIGGSVLTIKPLVRHRWLGGTTSRSMKLQILQSISFNCRAGLSPARAFQQVTSSVTGPEKTILNDALRSMSLGKPFADSIELMEWYDESTIAVLRTGENTGQLAQALHSAVAHFSRSSDLIKIIIGTVVFTSFDLFMAVSSIVGTRFGLIPSVKEQGIQTEKPEVKEAFEKSLELATNVNDGLLVGTLLIIMAIGFIVYCIFSKNPDMRKRGASILNRIPTVGPLLESVALSNALTILAELVKSGVRMRNSMDITLRATRHEGTLQYLRTATKSLDRGVPPRQAFAIEPLSMAEKIVIQSSNDSAQFSHSLSNIAQSREDIGRKLAKRFAMLALVTSLGYSGISVGFSLWVVYIQNSSLLGG